MGSTGGPARKTMAPSGLSTFSGTDRICRVLLEPGMPWPSAHLNVASDRAGAHVRVLIDVFVVVVIDEGTSMDRAINRDHGYRKNQLRLTSATTSP